ncbi:exocyst complex component 5 [Panicum miliaceum]|uniref:Exocyst complex component 5 n=1 Tax=Panicum miliaceum TaxID=4540 RepID=A0A3L6SZ94_PANMI|nr:exocyst complex component 5 [Panicum miliaceum]
MPTATNPAAVLLLTLDLEDSKGNFSFDALFGGLMHELLQEYRGEDDAAPAPSPPLRRRAARAVQALVRSSSTSAGRLTRGLQNLKKEAAVQDAKHCKIRTSRSVLEPNNSLILANFAQFLYLVQNDYDRSCAAKLQSSISRGVSSGYVVKQYS